MEFWPLLFSSILVGLSEFGDKTFVALFALAGNRRNPFLLWLGAMVAYVLLGTLAVTLGRFVVVILPKEILLLLSGIVFIILGIFIWRGEKEMHTQESLSHPAVFWAALLLVLTTEFGDKSQIAMAALAARFHSFLPILIGSLLGIGLVDGLAIWAGDRLAKKYSGFPVVRVASILFMGLGIVTLGVGIISLLYRSTT